MEKGSKESLMFIVTLHNCSSDDAFDATKPIKVWGPFSRKSDAESCQSIVDTWITNSVRNGTAIDGEYGVRIIEVPQIISALPNVRELDKLIKGESK